MTEDDLPIYAEALSDLTAEQIDAACRSALKTCRFWPTVADIRAQLDQAQSKAFRLESEGEWEKLRAWVSENVLPDGRTLPDGSITIIRNGAPRLSPVVEHAARVAGGIRFLESCTREQLIWAKKDFLAALANVRETGQAQHLIGEGEARRIVAELSAPLVAKLKSLPAEPEVPLPPKAEVRNVLNKIAEIPSEEEWEARKRDQKERLAQWLLEHPEHAGVRP